MMKVDKTTCITVGVSAFLLFLAIHYWDGLVGAVSLFVAAAGTFFAGAAIAYVLNILMCFYEKHMMPHSAKKAVIKLRRPVCLTLAFLTLLLVVIALIQIILPQLFSCFQVLISTMPGVLRQLYDKLMENQTIASLLTDYNIVLPSTDSEWREILERIINLLFNGTNNVVNTAVTFTTSILGSILSTLMSLIFAFHMLSSKETLKRQFTKLMHKVLGDQRMNFAMHIISTLDDCFHSYIVGQCTEALILGMLCVTGMLILRLDYALMLGTLVGMMALIPIIGPYIGAVVGFIMLFSVSPSKSLIFLIFLFLLQQVEGNLIYPHTVGSRLKLPGLWVLAAVMIGGGMMGIGGMIVFVPLTAALYRLLGEWLRREPKEA